MMINEDDSFVCKRLVAKPSEAMGKRFTAHQEHVAATQRRIDCDLGAISGEALRDAWARLLRLHGFIAEDGILRSVLRLLRGGARSVFILSFEAIVPSPPLERACRFCTICLLRIEADVGIASLRCGTALSSRQELGRLWTEAHLENHWCGVREAEARMQESATWACVAERLIRKRAGVRSKKK